MKPFRRKQAASGKPRRPKALGRVLLAEDDPVLALALEDALLAGGAQEVVICQTMKATVAELDSGKQPSAIVIDVHLADRNDGWALAELVALLGTKRPRIVFSTGSPGEIPPEVAEMGPVFEKPYDPVQLVEVLSGSRKRGLFGRLLR